MAELKIAEVILRERRKLKLTQEELANALMVSVCDLPNIFLLSMKSGFGLLPDIVPA